MLAKLVSAFLLVPLAGCAGRVVAGEKHASRAERFEDAWAALRQDEASLGEMYSMAG